MVSALEMARSKSDTDEAELRRYVEEVSSAFEYSVADMLKIHQVLADVDNTVFASLEGGKSFVISEACFTENTLECREALGHQKSL